NVIGDLARYETDRTKDIMLTATKGIDAAMKANNLDALLFPGANGANIAARPGYPTVTVPFGLVPNNPAAVVTSAAFPPPPTATTAAFPAGFNAKPGPMGVSFTGMACSEP